MENKFCSNCGKSIESGTKFCASCGTKVGEVKEVKTEVVNTPNRNDGNIFSILGLAFFFGGAVLIYIILAFMPELYENIAEILSCLAALFPLAGIILMIIGRVKYPKNVFLHITMWVIIGTIASVIVGIALLYITCYITCFSQDWSGCS